MNFHVREPCGAETFIKYWPGEVCDPSLLVFLLPEEQFNLVVTSEQSWRCSDFCRFEAHRTCVYSMGWVVPSPDLSETLVSSLARSLNRSPRSFSVTTFIQHPNPELVIAPCEASMPQWPDMDGWSCPLLQGLSKIEHLHSEPRQPDRFLWIEPLSLGFMLQSPCKCSVWICDAETVSELPLFKVAGQPYCLSTPGHVPLCALSTCL